MTAEEIKAGDAWLNYIKRFEKLNEIFNSLPEVMRLLLAQQIDIFAGKYPASQETEYLLSSDVEALAEEALIKAINSFTWAGGGVRQKFVQGFKEGYSAAIQKENDKVAGDKK